MYTLEIVILGYLVLKISIDYHESFYNLVSCNEVWYKKYFKSDAKNNSFAIAFCSLMCMHMNFLDSYRERT